MKTCYSWWLNLGFPDATAQPPATPASHAAVGALGSYPTAGLLGEVPLSRPLSVKLAGVLTLRWHGTQ